MKKNLSLFLTICLMSSLVMAEATKTTAVAPVVPSSTGAKSTPTDPISSPSANKSVATDPPISTTQDLVKKQQEEQKADIQKAEAYFENLKTVKSRFIQTTPDGGQLRGAFYMSRPGKLRFQYDPPNKDFIVADGLFIYFYDGQLKQQSNAPISQTLADFLLRDHLNLEKDLKVVRITRAAELLQITVVQTADPKAGELTLGFVEQPKFYLKKWRIKDAMGNITETELFDIQTGLKFASDLFTYRDPERKEVNK